MSSAGTKVPLNKMKGSFRRKGLIDVVVAADSGEVATRGSSGKNSNLRVKSVRLYNTLSQLVVNFLHPSPSFSFSRFRTRRTAMVSELLKNLSIHCSSLVGFLVLSFLILLNT